MGGFASGLVAAGFEVSWASDRDTDACATFRHRYPEVRVLERDVQTLRVKADKLSPVDVLTAGFPCQSFSQAGNKQGFKDDRGKAFFEIPRLLEEFPEKHRPKFLILENVANILTGGGGIWFETIQRKLREAGYWFRRQSCWRANVRDITGIPQNRPRVFMVAASRHHFGHNPFKRPTHDGGCTEKPRNVNEFLDRSRKAEREFYLFEDNKHYKMLHSSIEEGQSETNIFQIRRSYVRETRDGRCPTLTANMGGGGHNVPFIRDRWGIRRLTVEEVARLQGFDQSSSSLFPELKQSARYRLLGNTVCPRLAEMAARNCFQCLMERSQ